MSAAPLVWREYDQAGLDRQYNSRATVPDFTVYTQRYTALTHAAKATLDCLENLRYGPGPDDTLDLYRPAPDTLPASGAPVLVFLHGGDWRALSKNDSGFAAPAFVAAGAIFIALDFGLVPAVSIVQMGAQVRRALGWIAQNVAAWGGDPARLFVAGHSSGANLVGQALNIGSVDEALPQGLIKGATFMSGLGDLEPVRRSFRNANLQLDAAQAVRASLLHASSLMACPLLVAFGANEMPEYHRQAREVAAFWAARGQPATLFELAGRNHFDAVLEWADPSSALCRANLALLASASPPPGL